MTADTAPAADVQPQAKIFISYSRKDMAFADRLEAALKARGFEPLIDRTEIYAFEDWWKRIEALIGRADTVVFVLSPDAVASDVALKEVAHAASLNKRFAPIVCRRTDDGAVPETLRRLNFVFFDELARFEASADQLAEALNTDIGWVRQHTEYGEGARRWASGGRKSGLLLRSPVLEEAERWIASRPRGAPEPTAETQAFVAESRRGSSRRRNILTGSLAAGLVVALILAGLTYWQREVAVQQRQIADQQRKRAEDTLAAATESANGLVWDLADKFQNVIGVPPTLIKDILDRAIALQQKLITSGQITPDIERSEAAALIETVTALLDIGDTGDAYTAAVRATEILEKLAGNDVARQGDLSIGYERVGDVLAAEGKLTEAREAYAKDVASAQKLAASAPNDPNLQYRLAGSYQKLGDGIDEEGDLTGALKAYQTSFDIIKKIADPNSLEMQSDLGTLYSKIAAVLDELGELDESLANFRKSLAIGEHLAGADKTNFQWQLDLSSSYERVGGVLKEQGHLDEALENFEKSLAVRKQLATQESNSRSQHALALGYIQVGNILVEQAKLDVARESYQAAMAILESLARADPTNAEWQTSLALCLYGISTASDAAAAKAALTRALAILQNLEKDHRLTSKQEYWVEAVRMALAKL